MIKYIYNNKNPIKMKINQKELELDEIWLCGVSLTKLKG